MLFKVVSAAIFAAVCVPVAALSQSIAQIGGPAELPPASFTSQQYVDSRGCVFMRVDSGGQRRWYPRVNRDHKPVCNPGGRVVAQVAADEPPPVMAAPVTRAAPAPVMRAPMATVASRMMPPHRSHRLVAQAPVAPQRACVPTYQAVTASGPPRGKIGCYTNAPVAEVVRLRNGGTAVMCTRGDGTTGGWRPPIYPAGSPPGIALRDPVQVARNDLGTGRLAPDNGYVAGKVRVYAAAQTEFAVPPGYRKAWKDDRLNPLRGQGTEAGQMAQDQIWTRKVPAKLVADVERKKLRRVASGTVTMSTMNAPAAATAAAPSSAGLGADLCAGRQLWRRLQRRRGRRTAARPGSAGGQKQDDQGRSEPADRSCRPLRLCLRGANRAAHGPARRLWRRFPALITGPKPKSPRDGGFFMPAGFTGLNTPAGGTLPVP